MVDDVDVYLSERETAEYLRGKGSHGAPASLRKWRSVGGGPSFVKIGSRVLYPRSSLDDWIAKRRSPLVKSTSELAGLEKIRIQLEAA